MENNLENIKENDTYAILSIFWYQDSFDILLTGTFKDIFDFPVYDVFYVEELLYLIEDLNKITNVTILINKDLYKCHFTKFLNGINKINKDINIIRISLSKDEDSIDLLKKYLIRIGLKFEDILIIPV
jgi:hypothetical protein